MNCSERAVPSAWPVQLRRYDPADFEALFNLFGQTVRTVCARHYTWEQLTAWIDCADPARWKKTLAANYTLVAEINGSLAGFADLDGAYLDRLYVHKDWQGRGVATALATALERRAAVTGVKTLSSDVSITAHSFFTGRGYQTLREQRLERNGQILTNYLMQKHLSE